MLLFTLDFVEDISSAQLFFAFIKLHKIHYVHNIWIMYCISFRCVNTYKLSTYSDAF